MFFVLDTNMLTRRIKIAVVSQCVTKGLKHCSSVVFCDSLSSKYALFAPWVIARTRHFSQCAIQQHYCLTSQYRNARQSQSWRSMCQDSIQVVDDRSKVATERNEALHEQVHESVFTADIIDVEQEIKARLNPDKSVAIKNAGAPVDLPRPRPAKKPYTWPLSRGHLADDMSKHRDILVELAEKEGYTPATFKKAIELNKQMVGPRGKGVLEFVEKSLGNMKRCGVVRDMNVYKQLLGIFPKSEHIH